MTREESLDVIEAALAAIVRLDLIHEETRELAVQKWKFHRAEHRRLWPEDTDDEPELTH